LRTVVVIPARGGSKGVPHKNIVDLAGKPLIAYTIQAALKSKNSQRVIVSTDDVKIAEVAKSYGAEVPFLRPAELAKDDTPSLLVIQHAVKYLEENEGHKVDVVVVLQPTSPLRSEKYIDEAIEKLLRTGADSVVTVCEVKHHPFWSFIAKGDRLYPFSKKGITTSRRQDLPEIYAVNGAVYVVRRNVIFEQNALYGKDTRAVVMSYEESLDIDGYFDLFIAEMMLKHWKRWLHEARAFPDKF
jgi:N-acylneuraminate cytidylyltransferase/CMP-N,N'-diacetyllegionaminic acid synthase